MRMNPPAMSTPKRVRKTPTKRKMPEAIPTVQENPQEQPVPEAPRDPSPAGVQQRDPSPAGVQDHCKSCKSTPVYLTHNQVHTLLTSTVLFYQFLCFNAVLTVFIIFCTRITIHV